MNIKSIAYTMVMKTKINFTIGERIRELRTKRGISQEQLALRAEITTAYLGLLERNLKNPTVKVLGKICDSLDISLAEFFDDSKSQGDNDDVLSLQILSQINNCSVEEKKAILQLIKSALKLRNLPKS